jgi:hypothetical protein
MDRPKTVTAGHPHHQHAHARRPHGNYAFLGPNENAVQRTPRPHAEDAGVRHQRRLPAEEDHKDTLPSGPARIDRPHYPAAATPTAVNLHVPRAKTMDVGDIFA